MRYYIDIKLLPDPEFPPSFLMNALFAKLHRVLVQLDNHHLGISFPEVEKSKPTLGDKLRVHGPIDELKKLMAQNWLTGMNDHIEMRELTAVPDNVQHRCIQRVQVKSSAERLRRRYRKRHPDIPEEEVIARIPESMEKKVKLPFLQLNSQSTGRRFCLFLEHLPSQQQAVKGDFNSYGLSAEATVPWF